jgi:hypothetical protein
MHCGCSVDIMILLCNALQATYMAAVCHSQVSCTALAITYDVVRYPSAAWSDERAFAIRYTRLYDVDTDGQNHGLSRNTLLRCDWNLSVMTSKPENPDAFASSRACFSWKPNAPKPRPPGSDMPAITGSRPLRLLSFSRHSAQHVQDDGLTEIRTGRHQTVACEVPQHQLATKSRSMHVASKSGSMHVTQPWRWTPDGRQA